jgi:hypothetical protein
MADVAPEIHAKAVLKSLAKLGDTADALTDHVDRLASTPLPAPADVPNLRPPVTPK